MLPFRRFGAFISRISLTVFLLSTMLFFSFGFIKHLVKNDTQRYVPVGNKLFKNHHHTHDHHHHEEPRHADRRV
jgi:hypothetical protein